MTGIGGIGAGGGPPAADEHTRLRQTAQQFEGLFLAQLFKEMRASVPNEGLTGSSAGQETFTGFFDDAIAQEAAKHSTRGLGEALYRQLARRLDGAPPTGDVK